MTKAQLKLFSEEPFLKSILMSEKDRPSKTHLERRTYIGNLLVEESFQFLAAALEHPQTSDFIAFLRENLPQNSSKTRQKNAEYIAYRYSRGGVMNVALASFLKFCPDERAKREVLWFETVRAVPMLREVCEAWLSNLPETGASRQEFLSFLATRVGNRNPAKMAQQALGGIRKLGHLKNKKLGHYLAVWTEPSIDVLIYALSQVYRSPAMVKMETFKSDRLWQAMLWRPASLERLILEDRGSGRIGRVTQLDDYYQFALEQNGEERLRLHLETWKTGVHS